MARAACTKGRSLMDNTWPRITRASPDQLMNDVMATIRKNRWALLRPGGKTAAKATNR